MLVTNLNEKQRGKKMEEAVEPLKHINEARKRHETPECQKGCFHHLGSHSGLQALLHPERPWGSW